MRDERKPLSTRDIAAAGRKDEAKHDENVARGTAVAAATAGAAIAAADATDDPRAVALFPKEEGDGFRSRWEAIQTGFVDEPKAAVQEADALVAQVVTRLAQ